MSEVTIDRLQIQIEAEASKNSKGLEKFIQSVEKLRSAVSTGIPGLAEIATKLASIGSAMDSIKGKSNSLNSFAKAVENIKKLNLSTAAAGMNDFVREASALGSIGSSLQSVRDFGKGVTSMSKSFEKLKSMDIDSVSDKIKELVAALKPLTDEMIRAGAGVSNFGDQMKSLAQALRSANSMKTQIAKQTQRSRSGTGGLNGLFNLGKAAALIYTLKEVGSALKGAVGSVNNYIEDMNLFTVAMGDMADEAGNFTQSIQDLLGINAGEAARNMGFFQQLATSFGIASDKAYILSKNMTQLAYDYSSFLNIPVEDAFQKLRSGLVGEIEPMRAIGKDLSVARLQLELTNMGIEANVANLSQADKALLRYIVTMKQSTNEMGDMARTIMSPANALRVLQAQFQITARAIGSIFIPMLSAILPYAIAVIKVIGQLASSLAQLAGFVMPEFDFTPPDINFSGIGGDIEDIGDKADKAAKKMNNLISGFDELNILSKDTSSSSGIGDIGDIGGILDDLNLPEYDIFKDLVKNNVDDIFKDLMDWINKLRLDPLTTLSDLIWDIVGGLFELGKTLLSQDFPALLGGIAAGLIAYGLTGNPVLALAIGAVTTALLMLLPHKQQIEAMSGILSVLAGALLLPFSPKKFGLAVAISTLLTSGLIKLLGKDKAIKTLGVAFTALTAGLLAYKLKRSLPLAIGLGLLTTVIAGFATYTNDLQVAPALLAGVSAALVAFKWGDFSADAAGIVGIGVAIGVFAQLNDLALPLKSALSLISGALVGFGIAINMGLGGTKAILSAVAGALVGLGASIMIAHEKAKRADLESRFGDIALSMEEVEDIAKRLTTNEWTIKVDAAIEARQKLEDLEENIQSSISEINKLNWKVSIGIELTPGEIESYKSAIDSFVQTAKEYVQQKHYSVDLAIDAILSPGSFAYTNLKDFTSTTYKELYAELDTLGAELSEIVNNAIDNGLMNDADTQKMIMDKKRQIQEILDKISDTEFKAQLKSYSLDVLDAGVTPESFQQLLDKTQERLTERLKDAETLKINLIAEANLQYPNGGEDYEKLIADIQAQYNQKKATIILESMQISLDTVKRKYAQEVSLAEPVFAQGIRDAIANGFSQGVDMSKDVYDTPMGILMGNLRLAYESGLENLDISDAARANIKDLVTLLQPTKEQLEEIARSSKELGDTVPREIADALADINALAAISGNAEAINYMVGRTFSTDPSFLDMLSTVQGAAKDIDASVAKGLTDNLELVRNKSTGVIEAIRSTITGETYEITPILAENLKSMGITILDDKKGFMKGINEQTGNVVSVVNKIAKAGADALGSTANQNKFKEAGETLVEVFANSIRSVQELVNTIFGNLSIPKIEVDLPTGRQSYSRTPNTRNIPAFADGGVVREPTYALVGEYQNARSDPEVIAPQSTIKESVVAANGELVGALYQMATMIVQAIEDNATEVQQDPDAMFKVIRKKATTYKRNTGSPAF